MAGASYDDDDLVAAVAAARSWRGVLRHLDLPATSSSAIRSVRRRADRLGLDHRHFTAGRRWTDIQLVDAVAGCDSWPQVARALGLADGSSTTVLKGHARRLGIDAAHLDRAGPRAGAPPAPELDRLPRAGSLLAASWFVLSGHDVSWPLEPCPYDLVVHRDGASSRVQVKTTRHRARGSWVVKVRGSGRSGAPYDPDDLDQFFIIDGDLRYYLLPVAVLAGRQSVNLRGYGDYRVERGPSPDPSPEVP